MFNLRADVSMETLIVKFLPFVMWKYIKILILWIYCDYSFGWSNIPNEEKPPSEAQ